ncbi:MAG TPA: hypothetical protein PKW82_08785 [Spirochaetales bacterium]|nr:hypothetical protein [Spirochaetales bacterium]
MKKVVAVLLIASSLLLASCDLILFSSMADLAPEAPGNVRIVEAPLMAEPPKLAWNPSENASSYIVYYKLDNGSDHTPWTPEGETAITEWNMLGSGFYAVVAINGFGASPLSASVEYGGW